MNFDPYEVIRSGVPCKVTWKGIPGHVSGGKELSADEGPQELQEILEWGKAGGEVWFDYPDPQDPAKFHHKELHLPL